MYSFIDKTIRERPRYFLHNKNRFLRKTAGGGGIWTPMVTSEGFLIFISTTLWLYEFKKNKKNLYLLY